MNNISKSAKLFLCLFVGVFGFILIPGLWTSWQQSMGYKTPGTLFIIIVWVATAAAVRAIWKYQPENNSDSSSNNSSTQENKNQLDKS